ncbi:MAG: hypothetical protein NTU41_00470, partial [Chloroflexi bacterium]|nr:hypothetical protein [Chloroflexota bacterium]
MLPDFRHLPSIDRLISDERLKSVQDEYSRPVVVDAARQVLDEIRSHMADGGTAAPPFD